MNNNYYFIIKNNIKSYKSLYNINENKNIKIIRINEIKNNILNNYVFYLLLIQKNIVKIFNNIKFLIIPEINIISKNIEIITHYYPYNLEDIICNNNSNNYNNYALKICKLILKFHKNNFIIGNLKPSNILFDDDGNIYLSDFCQYMLYNDIKQIPFYKMRYSSPEMIFGKEFDISTDIWSLGLVLYFIYSTNHICLISKRNIIGVIRQIVILSKTYNYPNISNTMKMFFISLFRFNPLERCDINQIILEIEDNYRMLYMSHKESIYYIFRI